MIMFELLVWPLSVFTIWGIFAVRIVARHDVSMADIPEREEQV